MKHSESIIKDVVKEYNEKIEKVRRYSREILFKNGDILKIVNTKYIDGLRADVAIGPHANYITYSSNQAKKIWDNEDLNEYLINI